MIYIGIDPGLDGGIAFLNKSGLTLHKTPVIAGKDYDLQEMKKLLVWIMHFNDPVLATIENQISMPGQGLTSTLQTGKGFGMWLGLLAGLDIPYQIVSARAWQNKLFTGVKGSLDTKAKSEIIAKRLFPRADFRKSERATKANDGLTDAACIAEFGRKTYNEGADPLTGLPHEPMKGNEDICGNCGTFLPTARENDCGQLRLI
jgi:hypothetical protein